MSETSSQAADLDTPQPVTEPGFRVAGMLRSIGGSIVINAVFPYIIYRVLEPQFPPHSLTPLLASTVFPFLGLTIGLVRKKTVDAIAIISLVEITISIIVTLVASSVTLALVARALQGTLTGVFFIGTALAGKPIIYYIARQFAATNNPARLEGFERANQLDGGRTFRQMTTLWGVAGILISFINIALALNVKPADYLLIAPIIGIGSNVILIGWTIRFSMTRLMRYRDAEA